MTAAAMIPAASAEWREIRFAIEEFHTEYAAVLDRFDLDRWVEFFTDDAVYQVIARDNEESGLPLGLIYCEGKAMLKDRAYAILNTEMFAPRYLQLSVTNTRIRAVEGQLVRAEANYQLFETLVEEPTRVQQVGKYRDLFVVDGGAVLLKERRCVYDSVTIDNCLVFPV